MFCFGAVHHISNISQDAPDTMVSIFVFAFPFSRACVDAVCGCEIPEEGKGQGWSHSLEVDTMSMMVDHVRKSRGREEADP